MNLIDKLIKKRIEVCEENCFKCEHSNMIHHKIAYCEKYEQFVNTSGRKYFMVDKGEK